LSAFAIKLARQRRAWLHVGHWHLADAPLAANNARFQGQRASRAAAQMSAFDQNQYIGVHMGSRIKEKRLRPTIGPPSCRKSKHLNETDGGFFAAF
jgi:hypothetical protein